MHFIPTACLATRSATTPFFAVVILTLSKIDLLLICKNVLEICHSNLLVHKQILVFFIIPMHYEKWQLHHEICHFYFLCFTLQDTYSWIFFWFSHLDNQFQRANRDGGVRKAERIETISCPSSPHPQIFEPSAGSANLTVDFDSLR